MANTARQIMTSNESTLQVDAVYTAQAIEVIYHELPSRRSSSVQGLVFGISGRLVELVLLLFVLFDYFPDFIQVIYLLTHSLTS